MNVNDDNNQQLKIKCHGNRRDQRFRRKCRKRGMRPAKIEKLLDKFKYPNEKTRRIEQRMRDLAYYNKQLTAPVFRTSLDQVSNQSRQSTATTTVTTHLNKRKRNISLQELKANSVVPKSTSSISIRQPSSKKAKQQIETTTTMPMIQENKNNILNYVYRRPMYLQRSSWLLFQTLSKRLNYSLNDKHKQYIYTRLIILDYIYCLEVHLKLCKSFLEIGRTEHHWPEEVQLLTKTNDYELCFQYVTNYIGQLNEQINQYETELTTQLSSYLMIPISVNQVDTCLKEYVDHQRQYLLTRNNNQLTKFQDEIQANQLYETIMTSYPNLNPNQFIDQLIIIRQKQLQILEELLQFEMRILYKFLPSELDQLENVVAPITYIPLNNEHKTIELNNKRHKMIQDAKRQWLHISLSVYETKLQEYNHQFESILLNNTSLQGTSLLNDISRYNNFIGVSPEPYLDLISNPFNKREWQYVSLGPSYIRTNQSAIRPRKQQEIEIKKEHKDILSKVQNNLTEYHHVPRQHAIFEEYGNQLLNYLNSCYFTPLPYKDHIEAQEQSQTTASIRHKIKQLKLIIRVTDKSKNFYIGSAVEFEKKVQQYFMDTNTFIMIKENPLPEILNKVTQLLNNLRSKKFILQWQYNEMIPDRKTTELAHLYFNPKTHKDGIPLRPIENTIRSPTTNISKLLDKILRPIFDDKCKKTTIIDGAHLICAMNIYANKGPMKPSTLFCTFDIRNLYTMLPQEEASNILVEFLHMHGYRKVKGIPLDSIRKLASIVLKENFFVYDNKFYQQTTGGAMGSSFTLTLANIFMWKWQRELVHRQDISGEFFGRYIDDIFMTWNSSEDELKILLNEANQWHPNIKLDYKISQSLPFLDVLLTNKHGVLTTSVYHKPNAEPYVVPFSSDHPRHVFVNIVQTLLKRAVRYSSAFEILNYERRSIKLMLLYNGYPSSFIDQQFHKFFNEFIYATSILSFIENEQQYILLRHEILGQPTPQQSQTALRATTADVDNDQTDVTAETTSRESITTIHKKPINYADRLFLHYKHEKRFQPFKRNMHQIYQNVFKNTPAMDLRLIVGNRNRRDAKNELIRKRPKRSLLQCKQIRTKYQKMLGKLLS
ncbi:unnamed protein product [Adineta steineri]|uniref:Reverse transcriptase domain-containing protein n=1 Tax=Adineta steineri TaxID=433720 RepID=A0A816CMC9_9BILA|nr:unnamed protein product [Adineta steineri]CAF1624519.1 unnamed protein product [Adineta steineri]